MTREILLARFGSERADSGFNLLLQIHQPPCPVIDTHPDDPGRAGIREKTDALGAQGQRPGIPANGTDRFLQIFDAIRWNIAQKPECEMKLIRPGPAGHVARHERLQFLLNTDDFIPDRLRDGNRHEQPEMVGWTVICHGSANLLCELPEFKIGLRPLGAPASRRQINKSVAGIQAGGDAGAPKTSADCFLFDTQRSTLNTQRHEMACRLPYAHATLPARHR